MRDEKNYTKVPEGALILGQNQYYSRNCSETQLNNNVLVVGTSGAGKTRSIVKPNLLQADGSCSYVVSDPKGNLAREMRPYLESKGYKVLCMDFIHPEKSLRYDPLKYCRNTRDVQKLAHILVYEMNKTGGKGIGHSIDPFWDLSTIMLYSSIIAYLKEKELYEFKDSSFLSLVDTIKMANRDKKGTTYARNRSNLDRIMAQHRNYMKDMGEKSYAYKQYCGYNTAPDRTQATINICGLAKLSAIDTNETRKMLSGNDIDFASIGEEPTAVFVQISDSDRSLDALANIFYSQLVNELCMQADKSENSCLKVPVVLILDDFATNARVENFDNIISNIRSKGISAMIMIQSEAQLKVGYGESSQTIIDNCNTYVYMGGSDPHQAREIALRANKSPNTILNMPISTSWIFRRGQEPVLCNNFDLEWFQKEKGFVSGLSQTSEISETMDIEL